MSSRTTIIQFLLQFITIYCNVIQDFMPDNFTPIPRAPENKELKKDFGYEEESYLNFTEMANKHGYETIEHTVTTEDGYILRLFQIPGGKNCQGPLNETPLIIMHGLMDSSDTFLVSGPDKGLGYILPDNCYNTFYPNNRGNRYSRRHTTLDPDKDGEFWNFTFDEFGLHDLPAAIDFVLNCTGSKQVYYVGHSQGTTQFYILMSSKPEYNDKIKVAVTTAPVAYMYHMYSPTLQTFAHATPELQLAAGILGVKEVFASRQAEVELMDLMCQLSGGPFCDTNSFMNSGQDPNEISNKTKRITGGHFPCGTSANNLAHFGQALSVDKFRRYDMGRQKNLKVYGTEEPPEYNLTQITAPVALVCGKHDWLVSLVDVTRLKNLLQNVVDYYILEPDNWSHFDFIWGERVPCDLAPVILGYLK